MNLSDSDSDVDEEFMKHLFSDDMLKKLELEDRNQENKLGTRKEEPSTSHEYMDTKRGKRKITKTARPKQKTPRNISSRKKRDSLPLEKPEINFSTQTDTSFRPPLSCAPISKPLPTKLCVANVDESSEPMPAISDVTPVPPSMASRKVRKRRLHTKNKVKESAKSSKIVQKPPVDIEPPPKVEPESSIAQNFRPISPIDLPSSEDIWKMYEDLKKGLVPPSEAEWPLCCMVSPIRPKTPPPKIVECLTSMETPSKIVESQEKNPAEGLIYWDMDSKFNNDTQQNRNSHDEDFVFEHMTIGAEEERAMKDWIESEKLLEPLSDIEEYDMLLSLARDPEKNRDIILELLKPKNVRTAQVKQVHDDIELVSDEDIPAINIVDPFKAVSLNELRPERPIILEVQYIGSVPPKPQDEAASQDWLQLCNETVSQQFHLIENEECSKAVSTEPGPIDFENELNKVLMKPQSYHGMTSTVRLEDFENILEQNMTEYKDPQAKEPERPIILEVKDIGSVPPKPQDEAASQDWLQLCNETVSQQFHLIYNEECSKPASTEPGPIDFENELNKDIMMPRNYHGMTSTIRLDDFENILDHYMTEYKDLHAEVLHSKWKLKYGSDNLKRILPLPPLPVHQEKCLQKIRILRRPTKRNVECLRLPIVINYCKVFCTVQMNTNLNLQIAAKSLDNAVYNSVKDVIEVRYGSTEIGWIWANGTLMIINGRGKAMLSETQRDIVAKILGKENFKAEPHHNLLHLRLFSVAFFPWRVSLAEFSGTCALSPGPFLSEMQYVYYVDKELPGVSARLHESGMVQVFAMNTADADKMLTKLYLLTSNHRKAKIKVVLN
ncbi:uncharacterized protein [Drosophila takahashii]|uniref:uncharacterized protein n=1 Tax=Drosophila takahashii TaxID=29030 RepID=UPI001CF91531|nr:uncharacterized protein LOC108067562 [Drosophila takahashii]